MTKATNPIMVFTAAGPDGEVTNSPLFAAVKITARLCRRLRTLANLAVRHRIDLLQIRHPAGEDEIYWDFPPGTKNEDCLPEESHWWIVDTMVHAELWGRLHMGDGGYTKSQPIATTMLADLSQMEGMLEQECEIEYVEHEGADEALGEHFALAVVQRVAALRKSGFGPTGNG